MKQTRLIILLFVYFLAVLPSKGQDSLQVNSDTLPIKRIVVPNRVNNIIKTNPIALIFGCIPFYTSEFRLVNETTVSLYQSVYFGASYLFKSPILSSAEKDTSINPDGIHLKVTGFRVQAGYKFYINGWIASKRNQLKGLAPKGFYVSPHISYASAKIYTNYSKTVGVYERRTFFNVDVQAGYQLLAKRKFALDVFTGFGYMKNDIIYHENSSNYQVDSSEDGYFYNSNLKIVFGFNLGFAY